MYLIVAESLPESGGLNSIETFYGPFPTEERAALYAESIPREQLVHVRIVPLVLPNTVVQRVVWVDDRRANFLDGR